ncbi:hypothetical protein, partial [Dysgonomonas sp. Marseille-Q5470]|uniref:hypothetical protein n=1 Tax=Dysgonomonas sp. Marseille-Q5470 TaxID=3039494 RepID=UPI0024BC172C
LVFVNKIKNLNNQMNVKSSYFTPIGGILLNYSGGILFKYYLQSLSSSLSHDVNVIDKATKLRKNRLEIVFKFFIVFELN